MVKDVHVGLDKWKRTGKNTEEDDMWMKQSIFWELPYWKDLDVRYSIDVVHVEKCQGLVPQVPWVTGYMPNFWIRPVPSRQMTGQPYTSYQIWPHHSWQKWRGHQPK
jgi:hypothetical protein